MESEVSPIFIQLIPLSLSVIYLSIGRGEAPRSTIHTSPIFLYFHNFSIYNHPHNPTFTLQFHLHCKYEQRKICSGYEASMGCFYIALINHCILHRGVDLLMSQQFLYLFNRHPFIYSSCCHSSTEFMRMDSL